MELELLHDISQAGSSGDLGEHHHDNLPPATEGAALAFGPESTLLDLSKIMSVKKMKQLMDVGRASIVASENLYGAKCSGP
jgi:hypothetical protein